MQANTTKRTVLSRLAIHILDEWEVSEKDKIKILGLPGDTKPRALERYRHNMPLPDTPEINERLEHLFAISEALRTTFPFNYRMSLQWMHSPHRRFNQRTPLSLMTEGGLNGMISVHADLDCAYAWSLTDEMQGGQ